MYAATRTEKAEWMAHINKCIQDLLAKSGYFNQQLVLISVLKWALALMHCQGQDNVLRMGYLTMGFHSYDSFPIHISPVSHGVRILQKPYSTTGMLTWHSNIPHGLTNVFFLCVCLCHCSAHAKKTVTNIMYYKTHHEFSLCNILFLTWFQRVRKVRLNMLLFGFLIVRLQHACTV